MVQGGLLGRRVLTLIEGNVTPPEGALTCHWRETNPEPHLEAMGTGQLGAGCGLNFILSHEPTPGARQSSIINVDDDQVLLRLDEVAFPPGAIAYRHIHPGPGIRVLVQGGLRLISDHDIEEMACGDVWFEGAHSPVRAENRVQEISRFVRVMILPVAFVGKPSIQILAPGDQTKPRLQVTHRHIDHVFTV